MSMIVKCQQYIYIILTTTFTKTKGNKHTCA